MRPESIASRISIELCGKEIAGALDRHVSILGFDQPTYSQSHVLCIGAGGIMAMVAPTVVRKGIGRITLLDDDVVEASNLNRQRFYERDLGENKAVALARNLVAECTAHSTICGIPLRLEEAIARDLDLSCDVAVCGVDNNPARVAASRYFRAAGIPVIFAAVSVAGDHGYVFVQQRDGPCLACLFPDIANDMRYPCPGTPAIADILQAVGSLAVYAIDSLLMARPRGWNYRKICLPDGSLDSAALIATRPGCKLCGGNPLGIAKERP